MKRFFALFAALTLLCTGISAQTAACRTETGIAYRDAAGDGYVDSLCRLDICWPADRKGFPTVVWFHGGGLTGGARFRKRCAAKDSPWWAWITASLRA